MISAVEISGVVKKYHKTVEPVLKSVSLEIEKGDCLGLLGPNGAGKTTLISIITGLLKPDEGSAYIFGQKPENMGRRIGLVPQEIALYPSLTARENLNYFGGMYGLGKKELASGINFWLGELGLEAHASKRVEDYSGGMKRRLNLIVALMHNPDLLILDEPTVGIDIHSKMVILDQLQRLNKSGMTMLYTSHQFDEAEKICNRIVILDRGQICWSGECSYFNKLYGKADLEQLFVEITGRELRD